MVRQAEGEEFLQTYLRNISNNYKCAVGLVLGQIVAQKFTIIHLARTPSTQNEDITVKGSNNCVTDLDQNWIADHAKQTTRMLPGGVHVLGIFIVSDEDIFNPFNTKIKSILNEINKILLLEIFLSGSNDNEKLVLHYSPKYQKCSTKSYDVNTFSVQPVDLKFVPKGNKLVNFECTYIIDQIYYFKKNDAAGPLRKHIKVILDEINRDLKSAIVLFDNDIKNEDEKLENVGKKKKASRGSSNKIAHETSDTNKPVSVTILKNNFMPYAEKQLKLIETGGQIKIIGEVISRIWLNSKSTWGNAVQAVKDDIMRSLISRMEMHWDSLTEEELGEDVNSVHEPPRRVYIILPESDVTISDYLFPGEGAEDIKTSLDELLDIQLRDDLEVLDLEGQADISQYYKDTNALERDSEDFLPRITTDSNKFMYALGVVCAIVVLIISIIVYYYLK